MKKFYTFEPKNLHILSKMKGLIAIALLMVVAIGNVMAQSPRPNVDSVAVTICDGSSYRFPTFDGNDTICTETSIYRFTKPGAAQGGLDSIRILNLTVIKETEYYENLSICEHDLPYTYKGYTFPESTPIGTNNRTLHLKSVQNCDSALVHLTLTVGRDYVETATATICRSELPWTFDAGNGHDTTFLEGSVSGVYPIHFATNSLQQSSCYPYTVYPLPSCDSLVILTLTINPVYNQNENVTICDSELPYTWRDTTFAVGTTSGMFVFNRQTAELCDSVVTLTLTVNPTFNQNENVSICDSELPYTWRDTTFAVGTTSGVFVFHRQTVLGCDSTVTLALTVNPTYNQNESEVICTNQLPYEWRDTVFAVGTTTGTFVFHRQTVNGCDSVVSLSLTVNQAYDQNESLTLCQNELPYIWRGHEFGVDQQSDVIVYNEQTALGCDSIVTLNLTINPKYIQEESLTICINELPYTWRDVTFPVGTESGDTTFRRQTVNGCDSLVTLHLTINSTDICMFNIDVNAGENGTIIGETSVRHGSNPEFTVRANDCYYVESITKNGTPYAFEPKSTEVTVTFDSVVDHSNTLSATFAIFQYTVTAAAHGNGTIDSTNTYACDAEVSYRYSANTGHHIDSVVIDGTATVYTDETHTADVYNVGNIRANHTIDVYYGINHFVVNATAGANGTVTPAGETTVEYGATPTYTFTPAGCFEVDEVTVNGTLVEVTGNTYTLDPVTANVDLAVSFDTVYYTINARRSGNGSGTINGNYSEIAGFVKCNDRITFDVVADEGSHIDTIIWRGEVRAYTTHVVDDICGVTHAVEDMDIYVVFTLDKEEVIVDYDNTQGTVTPNDTVVDYGTSCTVNVTANAAAGYHIATIISGTDRYENTDNNVTNYDYTLNQVTSDTMIYVTYELNNYTVAVEKVGEGEVVPATETVVHGNDLDFSITSGDCHFIDSVYVNGVAQVVVPQATSMSVTIDSVISNDNTLRVIFSKYQYEMTSTFNALEGQVSDSVVSCGDDYTYTITPNYGMHVDTIYVDGRTNYVLNQNYYTFTNIRADHNIEVIFAINQYEVVASTTSDNGIVAPDTSYVAHNGSQTFTVVADDCYHVSGITVNGEDYDLANLSAVVPTPAVVLNQPFNEITVTGTACDASSTQAVDLSSFYSNMDGYKVYRGKNQLKVGSTSAQGYLTIRGVDLRSGKYIISFDAKAFKNHPTTMKVIVNGEEHTISGLSNAGDCIMNNFSVSDSNGIQNSEITFMPTNKKSIWIDNIRISRIEPAQTFTVNNIVSNTNVEVSFAIDTFTMASTVTGNGTINGATGATDSAVNCGTDFIYNLQAAEGNHVVEYTLDGTQVVVDNTLGYVADVQVPVTDIHEDHSLQAVFAVNTYTINTLAVTGQGTFAPTAVTVEYGADTMIIVTADEAHGYHIATVDAHGIHEEYTNEDHKIIDTVRFSNIVANDTLKVQFALDLHLITVINNGNGEIHPANDTSITYGDDVTFVITPNPCHYISEILVNDAPIAIADITGTSYTFNNVTTEQSIEVSFAPYRYVMASRAFGQGTISSDTVDCGSSFTYEIRANEGYHIVDVYVDYVADTAFTQQENSYDIEFTDIDADHYVEANFAINHYNVTARAEGEGTITCSDPMTNVEYNTPLHFTLTPNGACYGLSALTVNGVNHLAEVVGDQFVWNVTENAEVVATYSIIDYVMAATYDANAGNVTVDTVNCGTSYTYTMQANEGYHIVSYTIGDSTATFTGRETTTTTFTVENVSRDTNLVVNFLINGYNVTLCTAEGGQLTTTTPVVDHGSNCDVVVSANVSEGYHIQTITCGSDVVTFGENDDVFYTYTIQNVVSDTAICATFELNNYEIVSSVTDPVNGQITPEGTTAVRFGDTVSYVVRPLNDCHFISTIVVDDTTVINYNDSAAYMYSFNNIQDNHSIVANFDIYRYEVATSVNDETLGTITPTDTVDCGSTFRYTVTPVVGQHIVSVVVNGEPVVVADSLSYEGSIENIHSNQTVVATFGINHYTITATAGENGSIEPAGVTVLTHGQSQSYTITPAACHYISEVIVDGTPINGVVPTGMIYTFDTINCAHTIEANFAIYQYEMSENHIGEGTVTTEVAQNCGTDYSYIINAGTGYHIASYQIGDLTVVNTEAEPNDYVTDTVVVSPVSSDTTINVVFAINTYTVSSCIGAIGGSVTVNEPIEVEYGSNTTVSVVADAANGYHIVSISDDRGGSVDLGANTDVTYTYQVNNVMEDIHVCASFALNTFHIVATAGVNGTITPVGDSVVEYGQMVSYVIEPSHPCYYTSAINVDGINVWTGYTDSIAPYTYTFNVSEFDPAVVNHTISSEYTIFRYNMTSNAYTEGTVSSSVVNCGTDYDYQIQANYGWHIDYVVLDGVTTPYDGQQTSDVITVSDIQSHHNLDVYFALNHYTVTSVAGANGSIQPAGTVTVAHGESVSYTIVPDACYFISGVTNNGTPVVVENIDGFTYTIASVEDTTVVEASFSIYQYNMTETHVGNGVVEGGIANCGSNFTYNVTAAEGSHIVSIQVGDMIHSHYGQNEDVNATFTVYGVSQDTNCHVVFATNTYDIDLTVAGNGVVVPGDTTVEHGASVTYNMTADAGRHIMRVTVDGEVVRLYTNDDNVTTDSYTFDNVAANHTIFVEFSANNYTILAGAGDNGEIIMPGANVVDYNESISFTIRATSDCYHISRILVDGQTAVTFDNNENYYVYTFNNVDANHIIYAEFAINTYEVVAAAGSNGTVTPNGTATLNCGSNATYVFTPDAGYEIENVVVNGENLGALDSYMITDIHSNYSIYVEFAQITYTLTSVAYGEGTISPVGETVVAVGATQVFNLVPNTSCYGVSEILVDGVSYLNNPAFDGSSITLTDIQADMMVQAYFQIKTYEITSGTTVDGMVGAIGGTITEGGIYNCGSAAVFTVTENDCYHLVDLVVDGSSVGALYTYTFNNVDAAHNIEAHFAMDTYTVTSSVNDVNAGVITPTNTYNCGETPVYVATANEGYHLVNLVVDGQDMGAVSSYSFASIHANHTVVANFVINEYTISATANAGVTIAPQAGDTTVEYGASVTYIFTVDPCYEIMQVIVDGESVGAELTYTFANVAANHTLVVLAELKAYTITASANEGGTIAPMGETSVDCGGTQTYAIAPAAGYYVEDVLVDGQSVGIVYNYVFSGVTADHSIEVIFASNDSLTYTITATAGANGTITPAGVSTVYHGSSLTYVITPDQYYAIAEVIVDGNVLPAAVPTYTFANVTANHTIEVTFVADETHCLAPSYTWTTDVTFEGATLNWTDMDAASYTIRYKKYAEDTYTEVPGITATNYVLTGLDEATEYVWNVKSVCVAGEAESNWSGQVSFITPEEDTTSIYDVTLGAMNVYSYANDIYVANNSNEQIKDIQVYDMNGRVVYRGQAHNNPQVINVNAANGMYIVRIVTDSQIRNYKVSLSQR